MFRGERFGESVKEWSRVSIQGRITRNEELFEKERKRESIKGRSGRVVCFIVHRLNKHFDRSERKVSKSSNKCFRNSLLILLFVAPNVAAINPFAPRAFRSRERD